MLIRNAAIFRDTGSFETGDIAVCGERICDVSSDAETLDASGCYAIPGLIDIHLHGCVGFDFASASVDDIAEMTAYQASHGVTALCPTTLSMPEDLLCQACGRIAGSGNPVGADIVGINLEGPFLSSDRMGAQNPKYAHVPDSALFRRLQEASGHMVKLISIAPETSGAMEMIEALRDEVVCSVAHTTADYDTAMEAFARGARHVTHLYNAMPPFSHRAPGVVGAAFDTPDCMVELICDDVHIHPSVVRATFRMFGDDRIVMISDSMMAAGLLDGSYTLGDLPVTVKGNKAVLTEGGAIAGSVTNLMNCLRTAVDVMNVPLASAVKCASGNPAKAIGIFDTHGSLAVGKFADIVLLNPDLSVKHVILRGTLLKERSQ